MRVESTVTTVSWIPSDAVTGMTKLPFEVGAMHYDDPPPDHIEDLEPLRGAGRFRFANRLTAWIDVEDGRITGHGYAGGGVMGLTALSVGVPVTFAAIGLPDIQHEPVVEDDRVRFTQTAGGRPAIPAPRHVNHPPFVQLKGPTVWTTLELVINADGSSTLELVGQPVPPPLDLRQRREACGQGGTRRLQGLVPPRVWQAHALGWRGLTDHQDDGRIPARRELSTTIMRGGAKPELRKVRKGRTLVEQGDPGDDVYLLLNGVLSVEVDGEVLAELGPGAIVGERARLEARPAHVDPAGSHRLQGRGGPRRPARPRCAGRAEQRPPARGTLTRSRRRRACCTRTVRKPRSTTRWRMHPISAPMRL